MAKVSASASASGQTAKGTPDPESATAPAKSTRATRAQSREPQQNQRRSARNASSASVESDTSPAKASRNAAETDLPTVNEDITEENNGEDADLVPAEDAVDNNVTSPGRASAVSGTTVKTTFSAEEVAELDSDMMLDSLEKLDAASENLLQSLETAIRQADPAALDEIAAEGTKAYKLYQKRLSAFLLYKNDYVSAKQDYIQPHNVSRALFDVASIDEIPEGAMRPDSVIYKANLAYTLHVLLIQVRDPAIANFDIIEALEGLDQVFPKVVAGPEFSPAAFAMSIALTTQLAINRMASFIEDPNFNPQGLAEHAFITDSESEIPMYRHHNDLHLGDLTEEERAMCLARVNSIVAALKGPFDDNSGLDSIQALESVRQAWPWTKFIETDLIPYYSGRKSELDIEMHAAGGIVTIDASLKKDVQNRDDLKNIAILTAGLTQSRQSSSKAKRQSVTAAQAIRALNAQPTHGMAPVAQMTPSQMGGYDPNNQFDIPPASSNLQDLSQFQDMNRTQRASAGRGRGRGRGNGKAKSFNSHQEGAHRVEWDASQAGSVFAQPQSSVLGKRSRNTEDDQAQQWDPTQDNGPQDDDDDDQAFETKNSDMTAADARRLAAPASVNYTRPYLGEPPQFDPSSPGMQQRPAKRRNPGSSIPHPADYPGIDQDPNADPSQAPPLTQAQEYNQAAWTARQFRILNHSTPARERRPWTDVETEALMTYINEWPEEDNLHYAAMKRKDTTDEGLHALDGRTAEDIRFRARNMKVNFLLSRSNDIHPNWGKVQLAKKEIDKLRNRGIPYAQAGMRGTPAHMTTGVGGSQQ